MKHILAIILLLGTGIVLAQPLTVMTYNIRLDHAGDGDNRWDMRKDRLVAQLRFYEPGIIGIQEGLPQQVTYLDEQLEDYAYLGVGRDDGKEKGEFSAIYYQTAQFAPEVSGTFWLSETPDLPSTGWDAALPRVCTYALFWEQDTDRRFWVFNTHFDHVGKEARVQAMKLILQKMREFNTDNLPAILMGDLNVEPHEPPVLEMKTELKDSREVAKITFGPDATFNAFNFANAPARRIDYVAVNEQVEVLKYAVLTHSYEQKYISDHFPVICEVAFD